MNSEKHFVESSDVDSSQNLKLSSLFRMMQDTATNHAEKIGMGKKETLDRGFFWVIISYSVSLKRYPKYLETIEIFTYPQERNRFLYPRNFIIKDIKGNVIGTASSIWTLLEKDTHRISLHGLGDTVVPAEHVDGEEPWPEKLDVKDLDFVEERKVRYSDIDLNGHVNNTKYIEYILDIHDNDFYKENVIENITINYSKELESGQTMQLFAKKNDNIELIEGKVGQNRIFAAKLTYKK